MAIRLPLSTVLDKTFSSTSPGADSVAGVVTQNFFLPQDLDGAVMKIYRASVSGTGNISVLWQTTDDGGVNWFDVARSPLVNGNTMPSSISAANPIWVPVPVVSSGARSTSTGTSSTTTGTTQLSVLGVTGFASSSTLTAGTLSGLPILAPLNRVALIYTGTITTNDGVAVQIKVNSQSPAA